MKTEIVKENVLAPELVLNLKNYGVKFFPTSLSYIRSTTKDDVWRLKKYCGEYSEQYEEIPAYTINDMIDILYEYVFHKVDNNANSANLIIDFNSYKDRWIVCYKNSHERILFFNTDITIMRALYGIIVNFFARGSAPWISPCYRDFVKETENRLLMLNIKRRLLEATKSSNLENDMNKEDKKENIENNNMELEKDNVNHPAHYTWLKDKCGIEVLDIARHLNFNRGNAIKYILRAGHKPEIGIDISDKTIEDLEKAVFYLQDEIKQLKAILNGDRTQLKNIISTEASQSKGPHKATCGVGVNVGGIVDVHKIDGENLSWEDAIETMNAHLEASGTNYRYKISPDNSLPTLEETE